MIISPSLSLTHIHTCTHTHTPTLKACLRSNHVNFSFCFIFFFSFFLVWLAWWDAPARVLSDFNFIFLEPLLRKPAQTFSESSENLFCWFQTGTPSLRQFQISTRQQPLKHESTLFSVLNNYNPIAAAATCQQAGDRLFIPKHAAKCSHGRLLKPSVNITWKEEEERGGIRKGPSGVLPVCSLLTWIILCFSSCSPTPFVKAGSVIVPVN